MSHFMEVLWRTTLADDTIPACCRTGYGYTGASRSVRPNTTAFIARNTSPAFPCSSGCCTMTT